MYEKTKAWTPYQPYSSELNDVQGTTWLHVLHTPIGVSCTFVWSRQTWDA